MEPVLTAGRNAGKVSAMIEELTELIQQDLGQICTEKMLDLNAFHTTLEETGELVNQLDYLRELVNKAYGIE